MGSFSIKTFYTLALAFLFYLVNAAAIPSQNPVADLSARTDGSLKFLVLNFDVDSLPGNASVSKKAGSLPIPISKGDDGYAYFLEVWLGSDKQKVRVHLDTGSSDLWVFDESIKQYSDGNGYYNPKTSTSSLLVALGFHIGYVDQTGASGDWYKDTITVGGSNGVSIPKFLFADATQTTVVGSGILGIGYDTNESSDFTYHDFPHALKDNGIIDKIAYSLYLNSPEALSGTIIFGGIDQAKYTGELVKVKDDQRDQGDLLLNIESVSFGGTRVSVNLPGVLDSGTSWTYLPDYVVNPYVAKYFANSQYDESQDVYYVPGKCPPAADLVFSFNGVNITVPQTDVLVYLSDQDRCERHLIGSPIDPQYPDSPWLLGDTFLRHAYVYYDLEDNTISLAQVKYTSDSNIVSV